MDKKQIEISNKFLTEDTCSCNIIKVEPIIVKGESLPEFLACGKDCKHLASTKDECYLFRKHLKKVICGIGRCDECISYVDGTM